MALGVEWAQVLASQAPDFFGNIVTSKTQPFPGLFASGKCHVLVTLAKYQQFLSPKPFKFSLQPCVLSISPSLNLRWQCETLRNNRFERETIFSQSNVWHSTPFASFPSPLLPSPHLTSSLLQTQELYAFRNLFLSSPWEWQDPSQLQPGRGSVLSTNSSCLCSSSGEMQRNLESHTGSRQGFSHPREPEILFALSSHPHPCLFSEAPAP